MISNLDRVMELEDVAPGAEFQQRFFEDFFGMAAHTGHTPGV